MNAAFRNRLLAGEVLLGTLVSLPSAELVEILANLDYDWLFLDAEHGTFGHQDYLNLLQGAGRRTPCLIRVLAADETSIKRALDSGAAGIIVPQVNSKEIAEQVVNFSRYSPSGQRGVGISRAHLYGLEFQDYIASANDSVTVVVQAEHIEAVDHIADIVSVPGIDGVMIGPYDLSASMNLMGQVEHTRVVKALDKVRETCQRVGMPLGIFGLSVDAVRPYIEQGYTLITAGTDTVLFASAARELLRELRDVSPES